MIRDVIINSFNSDVKYRDFKRYWRLIETNPNKLSNKQRYRINELRKLSEKFDIAYELRNKFYNLFERKDVFIFKREFENILIELKECGIKECMKLGKGNN